MSLKKMGRPKQTHCKRGHEFTPANSMRTSNGGRQCLKCHNMRNAKWIQQNPELDREIHKAYRDAHPDSVKIWKQENPERVAEYRQTRRATIREQHGTWNIPLRKWLPFLYEVDPNCYYCRNPFNGAYTIEHKIPLNRPELCPPGKKLHEPWNIRLACGSCNSSKGDRTVAEWAA